MSKIYNYIILGGGITGLASARVLQQKGVDNFLLLEKDNECGGMCKTKFIDGHYFDIGGGHVLHSKYPNVLKWIFNHVPEKNFNKFETKVLIDLGGNVINFPIELNLWQLPYDLQVEYVVSYIKANKKNVPYENFEQWIRNFLGDKIADNYMIPYNKKLWCVDISNLDISWLSKIPKTDLKKIIRTIVEKKSNFDEKIVSHSSFYYPKKGGFQTIVDSIYKHIKEHIKVNYKVDKLKYDKTLNVWIINEEFFAKKIINTIPWKFLEIDLCGLNKKDFDNLEYISNVVSLWEREYDHNMHWMYTPCDNFEQHREFYMHNIAPHSKTNGVMTDINLKRWEKIAGRWKQGTPIYEHINFCSYPIPSKIYKKAITNILNTCKQYNLFGLGRWGQWQYLNVDHCIKQVLDFFEDEQKYGFYDTIK